MPRTKQLLAGLVLGVALLLGAPAAAQAWICEKDETGAFFYGQTNATIPDPVNEPLQVRLTWDDAPGFPPGPQVFVWDRAAYRQPFFSPLTVDLGGNIFEDAESQPKERLIELPHAGEWWFHWGARGGSPEFICADHEPSAFLEGLDVAPPTATFSSSYQGGNTISFDGSGSSAPASDITSQTWQVRSSDGSFTETSEGPVDETFEVTVPGPGSYSVEMVVTEQYGLSRRTGCSFSVIGDVFVPCGTGVEEYLGSCNEPALPASPRLDLGAFGWEMEAAISPDDGLTLRHIRLLDRYMADQLSLPYYSYKLRGLPAEVAELVRTGSQTEAESKLVYFQATEVADVLTVEARYAISRVPPETRNCLEITQRYEFHKPVKGDHCEPSGRVFCGRFFPEVIYTYREPEVENSPKLFESFTAPQRLHFQVEEEAFNATALTEDNELPPPVISRSRNPLLKEVAAPVVADGEALDAGARWDNFHQTWFQSVEVPEAARIDEDTFELASPGCPECVHVHWRWGTPTVFAEPLGFHDHNGGRARVPSGSNQDVSVGIARHPTTTAQREREADPVNGWRSLINGQSLGTTADAPVEPPVKGPKAQDVFWYEGVGHESADTFFSHGAWFAPDVPPAVYGLKLVPEDPKQNREASLRYKLSERAAVSLRVLKLPQNLRVKRGSQSGKAGANEWSFTTTRAGKPLRPGRYVIKMSAKDRGGQTSRVRRLKFRVRPE